MPVAEAQALARGLVIVPHEPSADRRALAKLAEACERFSPCVAIEDGDEPESLLLDISNLEHLWGSETVLTHELEQFFTRRGYRVRLAVADTVGLAWGLAHFAERERVACLRSTAERKHLAGECDAEKHEYIGLLHAHAASRREHATL